MCETKSHQNAEIGSHLPGVWGKFVNFWSEDDQSAPVKQSQEGHLDHHLCPLVLPSLSASPPPLAHGHFEAVQVHGPNKRVRFAKPTLNFLVQGFGLRACPYKCGTRPEARPYKCGTRPEARQYRCWTRPGVWARVMLDNEACNVDPLWWL